jgi:hypothetical protein
MCKHRSLIAESERFKLGQVRVVADFLKRRYDFGDFFYGTTAKNFKNYLIANNSFKYINCKFFFKLNLLALNERQPPCQFALHIFAIGEHAVLRQYGFVGFCKCA